MGPTNLNVHAGFSWPEVRLMDIYDPPALFERAVGS